MNDKHTTYYSEGWNAYCESTECPYDCEHEGFDWWWDGYDAAREQDVHEEIHDYYDDEGRLC